MAQKLHSKLKCVTAADDLHHSGVLTWITVTWTDHVRFSVVSCCSGPDLSFGNGMKMSLLQRSPKVTLPTAELSSFTFESCVVDNRAIIRDEMTTEVNPTTHILSNDVFVYIHCPPTMLCGY